MSRSKKLKEIVKGAADERTYGTDPRDPWSTTSKISESPNLNQYLLSRGFDPKHTPKNVKVAHSKSNQFKTWQRQHFNEDLTTQHTGTGVDHKTDLSVSPTKKRLNSLIKAKAHYNIPTPPGTMRKEDIEQIDEIDANAILGLAKKVNPNARLVTTDQKKKERDELVAKRSKEAEGKPKSTGHVSAQAADFGNNRGYGQGRYMGDSVEVEGQTLDEISLGDYKQKAQAQSKELKKHTKGEYGGIAQRILDRRNKGLKMVSKREKASHENTVDMTEENKDKKSASEKMSDYANKRHKVYQGIQDKQKELMKKWNDDHKDEPHLQVPIPEDVGDPMAAIKGVPVPESMAQKIKSMYKKKVSEDTYDSEKDDKYAENPTFGKNPKLKQVDDKSVDGGFSKKPQAAAILTGGTTLTGQKRDTVEIDPKMKNPRPGQSDPNGDRKQ